MTDDVIRVALSGLTWDEIVDSWGREHGMDRRSPRWEHGQRLTHARLTREEATDLKDYLKLTLDMFSGPNQEREPGLLPRLRRDVARLSGV